MTTKLTEKNISSVSNAGINWQSVIVADGSTTTTGVAGRGYFINTTNAAHTFILPAIATAGDTILIKDYAGTFGTNKLTIDRNGNNIQGVANNSQIGTNRASVELVYIDSTRGWEYVLESNVADLQGPAFISATGGTITTSGNFKIHTFTGDGCFVVATIGNPLGSTAVDYLVVAGGGGGATGAGGGAGGYRTTFPSPGCNAGSFPISATTYPITVGGGGTAANGSPSVFSTITSTGGGYTNGLNVPGGPGGSGGGGGYGNACNFSGGTGNTPPVSPPQGNPGGNGGQPSPGFGGGGGGGAGGAGIIGAPTGTGNGGAGSTNSITGSPVTYAGGGGGSARGVYSTGGSGGGGNSGFFTPAPSPGGTPTDATAGAANTGGGGGGGGVRADGNTATSSAGGGKGIVIIRYKFQ